MSGSGLHPISEMAMHQQFLSNLAGNDPSLFGIDPDLIPNHLTGYSNEDDEGEPDDGEDHDHDHDHEDPDPQGDRDVPTPPFFNGDNSPTSDQPHPRARSVTDASGKVRSPTDSSGPSAAGGVSLPGPSVSNERGPRMNRLPDPRAHALMQLVPMPSQLPPPNDPASQLPISHAQLGSPHNPYGSPVDPRYPGQQGMMGMSMMGMGGSSVGVVDGDPADQVGTWSESLNNYWQPMGLSGFQAPVMGSGGLAATIRDARMAWMVGENVCGHPSCLGRRFERKTNLLKHLLTHVEARPYICQVPGCDQAFKQKWLLDRHGRVHQANKEVHKCPVPGCTTTCSSLYNLRNHELVHSETKKFLCDFENCGRTFATARNLRLHQRTHTGDKPFQCDWPGCGMRYHRPAHLKRHQEIHTDNPARPIKPRKPRAEKPAGARRARKSAANEIDNEIDELAGDGESYVTRGVAELGTADVRVRPKRAAAVAAVEANRSRRWDEELDLGDDLEDEEDEDDEEDEARPENEMDDEEEDDDDGSYHRGGPNRGGAKGKARPSMRGRAPPIVSSSGGPSYGHAGMVAPFSNARGTYALPNQYPPGMIDPRLREEDHGSPGVAPAAEGMDENED